MADLGCIRVAPAWAQSGAQAGAAGRPAGPSGQGAKPAYQAAHHPYTEHHSPPCYREEVGEVRRGEQSIYTRLYRDDDGVNGVTSIQRSTAAVVNTTYTPLYRDYDGVNGVTSIEGSIADVVNTTYTHRFIGTMMVLIF